MLTNPQQLTYNFEYESKNINKICIQDIILKK